MEIKMKIGVMQDTEVLVCFTLDDERDIEWDTLKVYLHDHPEIDITDLMNDEWTTEISEEIYAQADKLVQEEIDDARIEAYITNQMYKE
jgi:hypothetical protein